MKHLALILPFTSIIISLSAHAQETTIGKSVYILNEYNHTATFKRWYGEVDNESFLVIPEQVEYNGKKYKITVVDNGAGNENEKLTDVIIPNGVTKIDGGAFAYCGSLKNIKLPASLVSIGSNAFYHCTNLERIDLPQNLTYIGPLAFAGCSSVKEVIIPELITKISDGAFDYCRSITDLYCYPTEPPFINEVFDGVSLENVIAHVSSIKKYKKEHPWSNFKSIVAIQ